MTQNKDLIKVLEGEIETRILPKQKYPYVPASAIRSRLNEAFGCLWNTHVISHDVVNDDVVLVLLELSATASDNVIKKEAFGSAPIHKYTSGVNKGKPVNLGDAYGNAVMDSLKACAKQLGIGNKELDVIKDQNTGEYVRVSDIDNKQADTGSSVSQKLAKQNSPKQEELKTDKKQNTDEKNNKVIELKKRLAASKKKIDTVPEPEATEKKEEQVKEETVTSSEPEDNSVVDHGFDYDGLNGTTDSPKNTQKLVILNLAKMKGVTIEDYIEQTIGKQKSIDELTASEAGLIVRSGLTSTTFKE